MITNDEPLEFLKTYHVVGRISAYDLEVENVLTGRNADMVADYMRVLHPGIRDLEITELPDD